MKEKQQPDVADLLQAFDGLWLVEGRDQFQYAAGGGGQLRLARNGELLLEAGADKTNRGNAVRHGRACVQ